MNAKAIAKSAKPTIARGKRKERKRRELSEAELDALCNFKALFTDEQVEQIEKNAAGFGIARRISFVVLARSADDLSKIAVDAPDVYGEMRGQVEAFYAHAKKLLEAAENASMRMAIADCREAAKSS